MPDMESRINTLEKDHLAFKITHQQESKNLSEAIDRLTITMEKTADNMVPIGEYKLIKAIVLSGVATILATVLGAILATVISST